MRMVNHRGYRQRMHRIWLERGLFPTSEQRICDQARAIRKNNWLTDIELESIRRRVLSEEISHGEENLERREETDGNMAMNAEMRTEHEERASVRAVDQREDTQTKDQPGGIGEEGITVIGYEELNEDEKEMVDKIIKHV